MITHFRTNPGKAIDRLRDEDLSMLLLLFSYELLFKATDLLKYPLLIMQLTFLSFVLFLSVAFPERRQSSLRYTKLLI